MQEFKQVRIKCREMDGINDTKTIQNCCAIINIILAML